MYFLIYDVFPYALSGCYKI